MFLKFRIKLRDLLPIPVSPLFPQRLPKQIEERNERMKEEMLGKFVSLLLTISIWEARVPGTAVFLFKGNTTV